MLQTNGNKNTQLSKKLGKNCWGEQKKIFSCFNAGNNKHKAICLDCKLGDDYFLLLLISDINSTTIKILNLALARPT
jgi:hypothetical protein